MEKAIEIKRRAQRCIQNGDLEGALTEYEKLVGAADSDPYNYVLLADLLYKKGDQVEASERYLSAVAAYQTASLYKNAIAVCKKMVRLSLSPAKVLQSLANLHALDGLAGEAALYYVQYAEHLVRASAPVEAAAALRQAFDVCQDNIRVLEQLSEAWLLAGENGQASQVLIEAAAHYRGAGSEADARRCEQRASVLDGNAPPVAAGAPEQPVVAEAASVVAAPPVIEAPAAVVQSPEPGAVDLHHGSTSQATAAPDVIADHDRMDGLESGRHHGVGGTFAADVDEPEQPIVVQPPPAEPAVAETPVETPVYEIDDEDVDVAPVADLAMDESEADVRVYEVSDEDAEAQSGEPSLAEAVEAAESEAESPVYEIDDAAYAIASADEPVEAPVYEIASADEPVEAPVYEIASADEPAEAPVYEIASVDEADEAAVYEIPADAVGDEALTAAMAEEDEDAVYEIDVEDATVSAAVPAEQVTASRVGPLDTSLDDEVVEAEPHVYDIEAESGSEAIPVSTGAPGLAFAGNGAPAEPVHVPTGEERALLEVEELLVLAQNQFRGGDRDEASMTLARAAQVCETIGRLDNAATIYRSLGRGPHATPAMLELWLANCERRSDPHEAGQVACELGDRALNDGDETSARGWFERAIAFDAGNETALRRIHRLEQVAGGTTGGVELATVAAETVQPAAPGETSGEGRVEVAVGRAAAVSFDLAGLLAEFQRGVEAQLAGDAQSHYDLGMTYREMGLLDQAMDSFRSSEQDPRFAARALEMVGRCLTDLNRWSEAAVEFRRALALPHVVEGNDIELRYHLGLALAGVGEQADALAEFERVHAQMPGFEDVDQRIADLRRSLGRA